MFFRKVTTRRHGKEYVYLKLIESYREGGKIKQRVIANLGNIEQLAPEKIQALINGLSRICNSSDALVDFMGGKSELDFDLRSAEPYRQAWRKLGLNHVLEEAFTDLSPPENTALLNEAAAILRSLSPSDTQPISKRLADESGFPELGNKEIPGIQFYQAISRLSKITARLESHLVEQLNNNLGLERRLYLKVMPGEFSGYECGITSAGTDYQIRPYRKKVWWLVTVYPGGIPIACRLSFEHLTPESIDNVRAAIEERNKTVTYVVYSEGMEKNLHPVPRCIMPVSLQRFSKLSLDNVNPWSEDGVVDGNLWLKTIESEAGRYILCYNLEAGAASDRALESVLSKAATELDKLKVIVRNKKSVREATILKKADKALEDAGCQDYFECHFTKGSFHYARREEVIQKVKTLRRTQVLQTDLDGVTGRDVAEIYKVCDVVQEDLKLIHDQTRMPVIYPYADYQHSFAFIEGQALIYALAKVVERFAG
jgi:hypothetical protein